MSPSWAGPWPPKLVPLRVLGGAVWLGRRMGHGWGRDSSPPPGPQRFFWGQGRGQEGPGKRCHPKAPEGAHRTPTPQVLREPQEEGRQRPQRASCPQGLPLAPGRSLLEDQEPRQGHTGRHACLLIPAGRLLAATPPGAGRGGTEGGAGSPGNRCIPLPSHATNACSRLSLSGRRYLEGGYLHTQPTAQGMFTPAKLARGASLGCAGHSSPRGPHLPGQH